MLKSRWLIIMAIAVLLGSLFFSIAAMPTQAYSASSPTPRSTASAQPTNDWSAHTTLRVHRAATSAPTGLSPTQIRTAYNLPSTGGTGTIAIVDAYDDPTVLSDLSVFSSQFHLPAVNSTNFEKHMMASTIRTDSGWALEISLDVQWAHAIAPTAKILLVEATSNSLTDLLAAVNYSRTRPDVVAVSMSWGASEFSSESYYDSYFTSNYGATFFASSGDSGAGVIWPSVSPNVVAVGGTTLTFSDGSLASETAWSGSGGGLSAYEAEPSYQITYGVPGTNGKRAVPDVSYDADPYSGVSVYDSTPYSGATGWWQVGGTSAGAPQWAAIQSLGLSVSNNNLYQDAKSASYPSYFRDITSGSNGHPATTGYDLVTGLGSPLTTNYAPVTTPEFSVSASPSTQTVVQGGSANYSITITSLNGFTGAVNLSVSGLPAGGNGAFSPNPTTSSSSLSITTSTSTPAGTYSLTITGVSGSLIRTTNVTLVVSPPGFSLSASPTSRTIRRGTSTTYTIAIMPTGGFNGNVSLSISGLPNRTTGTFTPNPTTGSSTLTIATSSTTARGTYKLTITGASGSLTSRTTVTLVVTR
jgi:subtilase family serine protease